MVVVWWETLGDFLLTLEDFLPYLDFLLYLSCLKILKICLMNNIMPCR